MSDRSQSWCWQGGTLAFIFLFLCKEKQHKQLDFRVRQTFASDGEALETVGDFKKTEMQLWCEVTFVFRLFFDILSISITESNMIEP